MVDSTDHIAPKTGLTPVVTISKNGAAFAAPLGAISEVANGWYKIAGNATDSNTVGSLLIHATASGADPYDVEHEVVVFNVDSATVTVGTNNDKTGYSLVAAYDSAKTAAQVGSAMTLTAAYDKAKTASAPGDAMTLTVAYDAAKTAATQASVNTISGYVDTEVGAIKVVTDKLDTALEIDGAVYRYTTNALEQAPTASGSTTDWTNTERAQIRSRMGLDGTQTVPAAPNPLAQEATSLAIKAKTDSLPSDPADASDIAASFGTVNAKLDTIDDFIDTEIAAVKAKTDQLVFTGGKVDANVAVTAADMNAIADALLKRDWNSVTGEAAYSALNAFRMLRNAWNTTGGTLTVKKEDGVANAWTRSLGTDPAAQPIISST